MGQENKRRITPEQMAAAAEANRQWMLAYMPPQVSAAGEELVCVYCQSLLHPIHNRRYDGTVGGFCNKLCAKEYEQRLMCEQDITPEEASLEVDMFENWKRKRNMDVIES